MKRQSLLLRRDEHLLPQNCGLVDRQRPGLNLVVTALDLAIKSRQPAARGIVHADHGVQ